MPVGAAPDGAIDFVSTICKPDWPGEFGTHRGVAAMKNDVELMRELLFELEARQTSPRSTVVISLDEEAIALDRTPSAVETGLAELLELEYIEGPGAEIPGFFLFRKLTGKGIRFLQAMRDPRAWERLKHHYALRRLEDNI